MFWTRYLQLKHIKALWINVTMKNRYPWELDIVIAIVTSVGTKWHQCEKYCMWMLWNQGAVHVEVHFSRKEALGRIQDHIVRMGYTFLRAVASLKWPIELAAFYGRREAWPLTTSMFSSVISNTQLGSPLLVLFLYQCALHTSGYVNTALTPDRTLVLH